MKITNLSREEVKKLIDDGWLNKKALNHFDVCKAIAQGKTQSQIAEEFHYSETKSIRWIKQHKCPECSR